MLRVKAGRLLLASSAAVGFALLFAPAAGNAASPAYCKTYAQEVAAKSVATGSAGYERHFRRAFDTAYEDCRAGRRMQASTIGQNAAAAVAAPAPETGGACDFARYRSSWDP